MKFNKFAYLTALASSMTVLSATQPTTVLAQESAVRPIDARIIYNNNNGAEQAGNTSIRLQVPIPDSRNTLFYFAPWLNIFDRGGRVGGSINLGYRALNEAQRNIWGGWLGVDLRDTGAQTFTQIAGGAEFLTETLSVRLSGFVPVGTTRPVVGSGVVASNFFQGTDLVLARNGTFFQSALSGVDFDVAGFFKTSPNTVITPSLGAYFLTGSGTSGSLGVRGRVGLNVDFFSLSAGVQHDSIFGTSALLSVGIGLPRPRTDSVIQERLTEPLDRPRNTIAIQDQSEFTNIVAVNPDTNAPYRFFVVTNTPAALPGSPQVFTADAPGVGLTTALNTVNAGKDANGVVYVFEPSGKAATFNTNVTVLDGTKLISNSNEILGVSTGTLQARVGADGPTIDLRTAKSLDFSNTKQPTINGVVTLANGKQNQVVGGFSVITAGGGITDSIVGKDNKNASIFANNITANQGAGISLTNPTSALTKTTNSTDILNNNIILAKTAGINVVGSTGTVNIINNTITSAKTAGIDVNNATGILNLKTNNIKAVTNTTGDAVGIGITNTTGNLALDLNNNTVGNISTTQDNAVASGISIVTAGPGFTTTAKFQNNTANNVTANGVNTLATGIDISALAGNISLSADNLEVAGVNGNTATGVKLETATTGSLKVTELTLGQGIGITATNVTSTGTDATGVLISTLNDSTLSITKGGQVNVTNVAGKNNTRGIFVDNQTTTATNMTFAGATVNTVGSTAAGATGVDIANNGSLTSKFGDTSVSNVTAGINTARAMSISNDVAATGANITTASFTANSIIGGIAEGIFINNSSTTSTAANTAFNLGVVNISKVGDATAIFASGIVAVNNVGAKDFTLTSNNVTIATVDATTLATGIELFNNGNGSQIIASLGTGTTESVVISNVGSADAFEASGITAFTNTAGAGIKVTTNKLTVNNVVAKNIAGGIDLFNLDAGILDLKANTSIAVSNVNSKVVEGVRLSNQANDSSVTFTTPELTVAGITATAGNATGVLMESLGGTTGSSISANVANFAISKVTATGGDARGVAGIFADKDGTNLVTLGSNANQSSITNVTSNKSAFGIKIDNQGTPSTTTATITNSNITTITGVTISEGISINASGAGAIISELRLNQNVIDTVGNNGISITASGNDSIILGKLTGNTVTNTKVGILADKPDNSKNTLCLALQGNSFSGTTAGVQFKQAGTLGFGLSGIVSPATIATNVALFDLLNGAAGGVNVIVGGAPQVALTGKISSFGDVQTTTGVNCGTIAGF